MMHRFESFWKNSSLALALLAPSLSMGLTSGPGMPEYTDFESVENTDLVNLATGDFTYSIPVMTVPGPGLGFPVVLSYHAGIQPEQEASWVGLGWNLQAGAITRQVNNIPDDFNRIVMREEIEGHRIHGWMASISWGPGTVGLSWDSEKGVGGMVGVSLSMGTSPVGLSATVGWNGVYEGVGVGLSLQTASADIGNLQYSASLSVGIHSKQGSTAGFSQGLSKMGSFNTSASLAGIGASLSSKNGMSAGGFTGVSYATSSTVQKRASSSFSGGGVPLWTPWTGFFHVRWGSWQTYIDGLQMDLYYGFLYSDSAAMNCKGGRCDSSSVTYAAAGCQKNCPSVSDYRVKKMDYNNGNGFMKAGSTPEGWLSLGYTGEDIYSVQSQGMSGTFKPYRTEDGDYYSYLSNQNYTYQVQCQGFTGEWFGRKCDRSATNEYAGFMDGFGDGITKKNMHRDYSGRNVIAWRFNEDAAGALYTSPFQRDAGAEISVSSRKIQPYYNPDGRLAGWVLTSVDGVRYVYSLRVNNYVEQTIGSSNANLTDWVRRETPSYAYAWLLTAILSSDYVNPTTCEDLMDAACLPKEGDLGGWVRFHYSAKNTTTWRTPVGRTSSPSSIGYNGNVTSYSSASGIKEVAYLSKIETPTHQADFLVHKESRSDAVSPPIPGVGFEMLPGANIVETAKANTQLCAGDRNQVWGDKYTVQIKIPETAVAGGTRISIYGRRLHTWTRGKWEWPVPIFVQECRSGIREQLLQTVNLPSSGTGGYYNVTLSDRSTHLEGVRIVSTNSSDDPGSTVGQLAYLSKVVLKNKGAAQEIGSAYFTYDYSLAQNTPNSESSVDNGEGGNGGRLTLKSVALGAASNGPYATPYVFSYNGVSTSYDIQKKDYWGNYCQNCSDSKKHSDNQADKWNLTKVTTPSGSEIHVEYEPRTVDFAEGVPLVMDGAQMGDYFSLQGGTLSLSASSLSNTVPYPFDRAAMENTRSIPTELSGYSNGSYVVFLGSYYANNSIDNDQTVLSLASLPNVGADEYIIESPRLLLAENPASSGEAMSYGIHVNPASITNSQSGFLNATYRTSCPTLLLCQYYVGQKFKRDASTGAFTGIESNGNIVLRHQLLNKTGSTYSDNSTKWKTKIRARVWGLFSKSYTKQQVAAKVKYSDGVRVSKLTFKDPLSGTSNSVAYSYEEGATSILPNSGLNYSTAIKHSDDEGTRPYLGSPGVLHGKVTATYLRNGTSQFSTEYHFLTSRDLPVTFHADTVKDGANNLKARLKILDRSALWGSLWKKVDKNSSNAIVRTDISQWSSRITAAWRLHMGTGSSEIVKDGLTIWEDDDVGLKVFSVGGIAKENDYFGITQKLWSNRYISKACSEMDEGAAKNTCIQTQKGAHSAQVEHVRFAPFKRKSLKIQDNLADTVENNLFDFLTGTPLLEIKSNRKRDGGMEYYATLKSLTHHHDGNHAYWDMKTKNMISQEFSTTVFRFDENPMAKDFTALSSSDLRKVVSSEFTTWYDYLPGAGQQFRKSETFRLRDTAGYAFTLPNPSTAGHPKWVSTGYNMEYDSVGHVVEFLDSRGLYYSQIFGYGASLPVAFASNARRSQIYYQSFELAGETGVAGGIAGRTPVRSYTGAHSLRVRNCKERKRHPASGLVSKEGCSGDATYASFSLRDLPLNVTYIASVWYYDEFAGSNPDNILDSTLLKDSTQVTRPGIFIGKDGCYSHSFPNGAYPALAAPAANGEWNANQRALGSKKWKRLWVEFTPTTGGACGSDFLSNGTVYLYANRGRPGSDIYYDELRVRPKNSLMSTYAYNARANMISTADANEATRHFDYDAFGNLTGVRNKDGVLLSSQGKRTGDRAFSITLANVEGKPDTVLNRPIFTDANGEPTQADYTLLSTSDSQIAWICADQKRVCTMDKSGTASIQIKTENGVSQVPITVTGGQLGVDTATCTLASGGNNQCQFDIQRLVNRINARGDGSKLKSMVFRLKFTNAVWAYTKSLSCFDGNKAVNNLPGDDAVSGCRYPAKAAHIRFSQFVNGDIDTLNRDPNFATPELPPTLFVDPLMRSIGGYTKYYTLLEQQYFTNSSGYPLTNFSGLASLLVNGGVNVERWVSLTWPQVGLIKTTSGDKQLVTFQLVYTTPSGLFGACVSTPCSTQTGAKPKTIVSIYAY